MCVCVQIKLFLRFDKSVLNFLEDFVGFAMNLVLQILTYLCYMHMPKIDVCVPERKMIHFSRS